MQQVVDTGLVIDNLKTLLKSESPQNDLYFDFIDQTQLYSDKLEPILLKALGGDIKDKHLCDRIDSALAFRVLNEIRDDASKLLKQGLLDLVIYNLSYKHKAFGALLSTALLIDSQFYLTCAPSILGSRSINSEGFKALFISVGKDRLLEMVEGFKEHRTEAKVSIPRVTEECAIGLGAAAYNLGLELTALITPQDDLYQRSDNSKYSKIVALNNLIHSYVTELANSNSHNSNLVSSSNQFLQRIIFNDATTYELCVNAAIECSGKIGGFEPHGMLMSFLKDTSRCMQYTLAKIISQIPEDQMGKENVELLTYTISPNRKLLVRGTAIARLAHSKTKEAKERFEALLLGTDVTLSPSDRPSPNFVLACAVLYPRAFQDYFFMSELSLNTPTILDTLADKRFCIQWYNVEDSFMKQLDNLSENGVVARYSALAGLDLRHLMLEDLSINKLFERDLKADETRITFNSNRATLIDFYLKGTMRVKHILGDQLRTLLETPAATLKQNPKLDFTKKSLEHFLDHAPPRGGYF